MKQQQIDIGVMNREVIHQAVANAPNGIRSRDVAERVGLSWRTVIDHLGTLRALGRADYSHMTECWTAEAPLPISDWEEALAELREEASDE